MIVSIPDSVQRDPKNRFWKHLRDNGLEFELSEIRGFNSWYSYSLPAATIDDALVLKLKFPDCKIQHFAL